MADNKVPRPRKDFVIIRIETVDKVNELYMPQNTLHGQRFKVEAIGPEVEDLKVGEQVLMTGQAGVDYSYIPNYPGLLVTKEGNVILVFEPEPPTDDFPSVGESGLCECLPGESCPLNKPPEARCNHIELRKAGVAFGYHAFPENNYSDSPGGWDEDSKCE